MKGPREQLSSTCKAAHSALRRIIKKLPTDFIYCKLYQELMIEYDIK